MEFIEENPPGGCAIRVVAEDCPRQSWNLAELPAVEGRSPVTWKSSGRTYGDAETCMPMLSIEVAKPSVVRAEKALCPLPGVCTNGSCESPVRISPTWSSYRELLMLFDSNARPAARPSTTPRRCTAVSSSTAWDRSVSNAAS